MADTLRTFIAVSIPPLAKVADVMRSLSDMKWPVAVVGNGKLHVTLKFLGDTPIGQIDSIREAIASAVADQPPFSIRLKSLGAFPRVDRPSVIWAGMESAEPLVSLAKRLDERLEPLGFARESRPFAPHLTLARIKGRPPQSLFDLLRRHAETEFGLVEIDRVQFIQSDLQREGARYTTLSVHTLPPA